MNTDRESRKGKVKTILLADDDDMIIKTIGELLQCLGYRVIIARDGQQALDVLRCGECSFDLILLDMYMPVMSGEEAVFCIREILPSIPIIFMSGFINDALREEVRSQCNGFIVKPFSIHVLHRKIQDLLNES